VVTQVKKNSTLNLIPVQHHFLIISCSYALNPAPAPAGFAIINPAKNQIRYSPSNHCSAVAVTVGR